MESQLSFICIRQHTFLDQKYVLQLLPTKITLNQIGKEPKYIIELELQNTISWQLNQMNQLISFSIMWNNIEKQFHSTHEDLLKLRQTIKNKIMYKTVRHLYKPMQQLGEGNFDEVIYSNIQVYLCIDRINGNSYEIKCLAKNQFEDSITRIHNEISCLTNIRSDQVQNLHEVFNGENTVYLIQEYLEGLNLYELIMNVALDRTQILIIMKQLITAVRDIHSSNIMHRDIKPTNIVFKNKDSIEGLKLTEFHLAVHIYPSQDLRVCGTPGYAAPEKFKDSYNEKVDLFSVGCIFFKLVTTRDVFPGKTSNEILRMNKICNIDFKILQLYKLTPEETDLLISLLEIDPEKRISAEAALSHPYFQSDNSQNDQQQLAKKKSIQGQTTGERSNNLLQKEINEIEMNPEELQVDQESPRISAIPNFKVLKKDSQLQSSQAVRKSSKLKKSETQEYTQLNLNKSRFQARNSVHQTIV
ncbi:unnamed protein product (macronuclear) [Paramecium tetraurelia]|uniref:Protein kinase domain-containing protein n=1 Tax=Paramecium tetraurelia TaxID=5888 RepID=A0EFF2_PARTE|nr:uncharacterized protein GSPATT00026366001 [Paramecium tetraurelia]CAK94043.1 unnamed protein product [Paramecium tetraurelia]|eukprot:XP_001461416.1 hypothetical protein (macronuclear) [Paramecium tetraurelia strain d4-2]